MPIPTRSQSVKAPSQTPAFSQLSDPPTSRSSARAGAARKVSERASRLLAGRARPSPTNIATCNARSSSTTTSSLPRPRSVAKSGSQQPTTETSSSEVKRTPHAQTRSALPSLGHSRSQSTSVVLLEGIAARHVSSTRPVERGLLNKPAFNTHQQKFGSEKSNPAAHIQSSSSGQQSLHMVSPQQGRQNSQLQDELFQLSVVHQHSARVLTKFEESVRRRVDAAAVNLREEREVVAALEAQHQQQVNVTALSTWLHEDKATVNERKIELLSFCLNELADMGNEGQVIDQLRSAFARWLEPARKITESQTVIVPDLSDDPEIRSTGQPGMKWSCQVDECLKRLDLCRDTLNGLGETDNQSGIGLVLASHRRLVAVIADELCAARKIVAKVTTYEEHRISSALNTALAELEVDDGVRERTGLWTSVELR